MMNKRIKLNDDQIEYLANLPETGMGYQVVNIRLKNGLEFKDLIVYNSTYLEIQESINFNSDDIAQISIKATENEGNSNED